MCFHLSMSKTAVEIANRFDALFEEAFDPVYHANGFAHPRWPVVTSEKPSSIQLYQWGLVPRWIKTREDALRIQNNTLNARSETVFEKPSFRFSVFGKRCLVPVTGFFEWRTVKGKKYPYFITQKDGACFALAGIYENWIDAASGGRFDSFSILTADANALLAKIHDKKRMPVILPARNEKPWLDAGLDKKDILQLLNQTVDEDFLKAHPVSRRITSVAENTDTPQTLAEYHYPEIDDLASIQ